MTLSFKTHHTDGKPTHFVEKIWEGFYSNSQNEYFQKLYAMGYKNIYDQGIFKPKIHTLRYDEKRRWRVGMPIHFVINNRMSNRYQFAPVLKVTGIQEVELVYNQLDNPTVIIDGRIIAPRTEQYFEKINQIAVNDGFNDAVEMFSFFFFDKNYNYKVNQIRIRLRMIHWTDLKY